MDERQKRLRTCILIQERKKMGHVWMKVYDLKNKDE